MRRMESGAMEDKYIREMDPKEPDPGIEVVAQFMSENFPGMRIESMDEETSAQAARKIDLVSYVEGKPAVGLQVTSAIKERAQSGRIAAFQEAPFVTVPDSDHDIPRALIYLDEGEARGFLADQNFESHPGLGPQILKSLRLSLSYDLSITKNRVEQERIQKYLDMVTAKETEIKTKKGGSKQMRAH